VIAGNKIILGTVTGKEVEAKRKEIAYADKIDPKSLWYIEPAQDAQHDKE
jgi:hypothetical protein